MKHLSVLSTAFALTVAASTAAYAQANHGRQSERQSPRQSSRVENPLHAPQAQYPRPGTRTVNPLHASSANDRSREYDRDAYREQQRVAQLRAEDRYRYDMGGTYRETSQYGADMLRQAVNVGYQQGVRAGERDRQDGRRPSFENSPAYRDATVGYGGNYVGQSDYSYYFRQGFQRGYQDGYDTTSRYGRNFNGNSSMLSDVMSGILGLQAIR